ncbi:MAG: hypothetical protein Q7S64_01965 [bacterium]|nr:hypothetical protein [bacterium]
MYKMIRCGADFCLVIVVTPYDATPQTADAHFYRYADWIIETGKESERGQLVEIDQHLALSYFSGIADGIGFEVPPDDDFPDLAAALAFINEKREAVYQQARAELIAAGIDPDAPI